MNKYISRIASPAFLHGALLPTAFASTHLSARPVPTPQ